MDSKRCNWILAERTGSSGASQRRYSQSIDQRMADTPVPTPSASDPGSPSRQLDQRNDNRTISTTGCLNSNANMPALWRPPYV